MIARYAARAAAAVALSAAQHTIYGAGTIPETLRKSCIGSILPTCQVFGGMVEWIKMGALSLLISTLLMAAIIGPVLLLAQHADRRYRLHHDRC